MSDTPDVIETFGPVHPGAILREEFIEPLGLTAGRVAKACGIARTRIERIAAEEIGISGDTAIRLGRFFRTTPHFWMNLQQHYELERAAAALGSAVEAIVPVERAEKRRDRLGRDATAENAPTGQRTPGSVPS